MGLAGRIATESLRCAEGMKFFARLLRPLRRTPSLDINKYTVLVKLILCGLAQLVSLTVNILVSLYKFFTNRLSYCIIYERSLRRP